MNWRKKNNELQANNSKLLREQITGEQKLKIQRYNYLYKEKETCKKENTKLEVKLADESDKCNNLQSELNVLKPRLKNQKSKIRKHLVAIYAIIFISIITMTGSYFYVDSSLQPPDVISTEAKEQFIKYAPEYVKIINERVAYDREQFQNKTEELKTEIAEASKDRESWFSYLCKIFLSWFIGFVMGICAAVGKILFSI